MSHGKYFSANYTLLGVALLIVISFIYFLVFEKDSEYLRLMTEYYLAPIFYIIFSLLYGLTYNIINQDGLKLSGYSGDRINKNIKAYQKVTKDHSFDLIIVSTKANGVKRAAENILPILKDDTTVITIQNGLGSSEELLNILPDLKRLRLSSIDPAEIDKDLMDLIINEKRVLPHIHFSAQSGDDMILKRMKRRHNVKQIIELLNEIRNISDNVTFGADFICGFPTETEEMFMNTYTLVKKLQITHLHVFPYSAKAGTPASKMPQVFLEERRKRAKALRELGNQNYLNNLQKQTFRPQKVLVETNDGIGKTENNFKMKIPSAKKGDIVSIKPNDIKDNYLIVN